MPPESPLDLRALDADRDAIQSNRITVFFCNGPDEVKSPSDCHAAELTLLSVVSAEAATRCY